MTAARTSERTAARLTQLGWVRQLTVTMTDCMVDSFLIRDELESLRLTFSATQVEQ